MRWLIGIDVRPSSHGAVAYGAWLHEHAADGAQHDLVGAHVLETRDLSRALQHVSTEALTGSARRAAHQVLEEASAGHIEDVHIVWGQAAETRLADACREERADGLIVGRAAAARKLRIVRLGRVARRLLRSLPTPVIVVPPDLDPATLTGPVIAATDLDDPSTAACRFAATMARSLSRELLVVHGVPLPEDYGASYIPDEALDKLRREHQEEGERDLASWTKSIGLEGHGERVIQGRVYDHLMELANELKPALIVTGSRRLSAVERLLLASMGSDLAAHSAWPVAVVADEAQDAGSS